MDMKPILPPLPDKVSLFGTKWHIFSEGFKGHCVIVHGSMNISLAYVLHAHKNHNTVVIKRLMVNLVALGGRKFNKDTILMWQLLHLLVLERPAWNYMKQYNERQNSRMDFLTLQTRGEGEAAVDSHHSAEKQSTQKP
jgi:hypothetical protein